jgi:hypothetical protein
MQPHHFKQLSIGVLLCLAFVLGATLQSVVPFARVTAAQAVVVDGHATLSDPAAPAAPAGGKANLTYQGRLTNNSGTPINTTVNATFKFYDSANSPIYTATRTITPTNGLFTVYLGDGADPDLDSWTLSQAASIGVSVGGNHEMLPRQALRSVVGHSENGQGVVGSSNTGYGVNGFSDSGTGVYGFGNSAVGVVGASQTSNGVYGYSVSGEGVVGQTESGDGVAGWTGEATRAGVLATNVVVTGTALEISSGGIKATGAGIGTSTFAFIHVSSDANFSNNSTLIDNALTNGDPTAMLFVTHVHNPAGVPGTYFNIAFGVDYNTFYDQWAIYREDNGSMPSGIAFNVMVIKR